MEVKAKRYNGLLSKAIIMSILFILVIIFNILMILDKGFSERINIYFIFIFPVTVIISIFEFVYLYLFFVTPGDVILFDNENKEIIINTVKSKNVIKRSDIKYIDVKENRLLFAFANSFGVNLKNKELPKLGRLIITLEDNKEIKTGFISDPNFVKIEVLNFK